MNKEKEKYLEVICNYFNNLKGCMEDYEVKELVKIIFDDEFELKENELSELTTKIGNILKGTNNMEEDFINEFKKIIKGE